MGHIGFITAGSPNTEMVQLNGLRRWKWQNDSLGIWFSTLLLCAFETYCRLTHDTRYNSLIPISPSDVSLLLGTVPLHGCYEQAFCLQIYDMIYLLTAIGLPPDGSSTIHIYKQTVHRTTQRKHNMQNRTYITIRIHKHNNKNT